MKIKRIDDIYTKTEYLNPGDCILYNGCVLLATTDFDFERYELTFINIENGEFLDIDFGTTVLRLNGVATLTMED
jgi:hypothetical protein